MPWSVRAGASGSAIAGTGGRVDPFACVIHRSNRVCRGEEPAWMRPVASRWLSRCARPGIYQTLNSRIYELIETRPTSHQPSRPPRGGKVIPSPAPQSPPCQPGVGWIGAMAGPPRRDSLDDRDGALLDRRIGIGHDWDLPAAVIAATLPDGPCRSALRHSRDGVDHMYYFLRGDPSDGVMGDGGGVTGWLGWQERTISLLPPQPPRGATSNDPYHPLRFTRSDSRT